MNKLYIRLKTMLLMFALGLSSVGFFNWANDYLTETPVDLPKVKSNSPIMILPRMRGEYPFITGGGSGGNNDNCEAGSYRKRKKTL